MVCSRCGIVVPSVGAESGSMIYGEMDRDLVAVLNISYRGWLRFDHSKGAGSEAVTGNETTPLILRVDPAKLTKS